MQKPILKEMLKYSLPMMPTTVIWWITNVSDRFIVTAISGSGENGLYSAAYKISDFKKHGYKTRALFLSCMTICFLIEIEP